MYPLNSFAYWNSRKMVDRSAYFLESLDVFVKHICIPEKHENCRDERRKFEPTTGDDEHVRVAQQHRQIDPGHQLPREIPAHLCPPVSSLFPPGLKSFFLVFKFSWN